MGTHRDESKCGYRSRALIISLILLLSQFTGCGGGGGGGGGSSTAPAEETQANRTVVSGRA